ncbi:hypothetical protein [Pseudomonas sp. MYb185]|uniref:hypothetical protein n=1 Tax=Pseudomonas sp. MYb185 TaxID=1848729 RepID=UPI002114E9DA|nr:hypothetical protein [Pseudomonas sp. MYb185]
MEYSPFIEQTNTDSGALPLRYLSTQVQHQRLNIPPLNITADGAGKNLLKGLVVPFLHAWMVLKCGTFRNVVSGQLGT